MTTNEMIVREKQMPAVQNNPQVVEVEPSQRHLPYDGEQIGELVGELIEAVKDDRANTKRAISADITSTKSLLTQNDRLSAAYDRELQRPDLSEEWRKELLDRMEKKEEESAREIERSREFQREQLDHSHGLPLKIAAFIILLAVGGVGGTALIRAVRS